MDWSTVTLIIVCMLFLTSAIIALMFYRVLMWIVRGFARTTKKTAHVLSAPYPRRR